MVSRPATAGSRRAAGCPETSPVRHAALDRGAVGHDLVGVHGPCSAACR
ncbi:hypothetical protein EVA_21542 [gut metagenome]|uniref:Uncharacterized protein n=1 Tax=gut metagenome TaxID=749906 RepID=J9F636_9ZZZZ